MKKSEKYDDETWLANVPIDLPDAVEDIKQVLKAAIAASGTKSFEGFTARMMRLSHSAINDMAKHVFDEQCDATSHYLKSGALETAAPATKKMIAVYQRTGIELLLMSVGIAAALGVSQLPLADNEKDAFVGEILQIFREFDENLKAMMNKANPNGKKIH